MTQQIEIGQSIIKNFFDYYENNSLDDESEFFPILKIIIWGIIDTCGTSKEKQYLENRLKDYAKQLYVSLWIIHAEEDEEEVDIEYEKKEAIRNFEEIYKKA